MNKNMLRYFIVCASIFASIFILAACAAPDSQPATDASESETTATEASETESSEAEDPAEGESTDGEAAAEEEPVQEEPASDAQDAQAEDAGSDARSSDTVRAGDLEPAARNAMYSAPPAMTIDTSQYYYATLVTEKGDIKLQLFAQRAPVTVNNFVFLARDGYYDNTTFHRVLDGFMAQAGDPTGTGAGGPGYEFEDEFYPGLGFDRAGLLAMANRGPRTNGSQIFITFGPTSHLNDRHTIFGEVIEGNDVLDQITRRDPNSNPGFGGDVIETVLIEESDESILATPTPAPPTPTPLPTPTPFAASSVDADERPLAAMEPAERANYFNAPPEVVIDETQTYKAIITTSQGEMTLELYADQAPVSVNNFVLLSNLGFYDGVPVNQVIPDQVTIFGSPDNNPLSDAGYQLTGEKGSDIELAIGMIAYVPTGNGTVSSSSQLLLALIVPPPQALQDFSFFGQVVEGVDVLTALTAADTIDKIEIVEGE
ncbi:MAG: peptidylprolyl isomerase [Chloroflexota bacterium]